MYAKNNQFRKSGRKRTMKRKVAEIFYDEEEGFGIKPDLKVMDELDMFDESRIGQERWIEFLQGTAEWCIQTLVNDYRDIKDKYEDYVKGRKGESK